MSPTGDLAPWCQCQVTVWRTRGAGGTGGGLRGPACLLHDADAAVQLALSVVVVDVWVAATHVGSGRRRQAAPVVGTAVLEQDVHALLAACPPGVRQRRLAASVPALHVNAVLWRANRASGQRPNIICKTGNLLSVWQDMRKGLCQIKSSLFFSDLRCWSEIV